jgi:DNA polymerase III delta prime subunit
MAFSKAIRRQAKVRIALDGPSGSGKTMSALLLAKALGGTTALIDSEHGSASLYANVTEFDVMELTEFSLRTYIDAIGDAAQNGYKNLVIDSLSHAWQGKGGALEQVDRAGGSKFSNGWKTVTPLYNQLIESILSYPGNVIATMRSKMAYEVVQVAGKGAVPQKLGMAPIIREGSEYEFTFVLDMAHDGNVTVSKTRCQGAVFTVGEGFPREELLSRMPKLQKWLGEGAVLTEKDELREAIRLSASDEALGTLLPRLAALTEAERDELRPLFVAKKEQFAQEVA